MPPPDLDVLRELRHVAAPVSSAEAEDARRRRISARIDELQRDHVEQAPRRARTRVLLAVAGAVAAAASLAVWAYPREQPANEATRGEYAEVLAGAVSVASGAEAHASSPRRIVLDASAEPRGELLAVEQATRLRMPSRASLSLAGGSRFRVHQEQTTDGQRDETIFLAAGSVELDVPKLGKDRRLRVETADAIVEVRGTRFSVSAPAAGTLGTRVSVSAGEVVVRTLRGALLLSAGQSWESAMAAQATANAASAAPVTSPPASAAPGPSPLAALESGAPPSVPAQPARAVALDTSTLGEANRLMQAALLAKTSGMPELALQRLDDLIRRHPRTELAANARAERFRLLAQLGRAALAQRAARQYLDAHPEGFASTEARALLDGR